ncbi:MULTISPECIES: GtrA family protein [Dyella]|uniref:GtrA family protein n=2 Tax=Dyella TaxID=231454 RepID=A0A4R0Z0B1_9GAMM|nr:MULTISPECIES: GtrA family protein [Dyella]TBR39224.1 GtrA family protein [Dyella terrae]TCI13189.1 GtrA family protein [Dyella soli]
MLRREAAMFAVGGVIGLVVDAGVVQLLVTFAGWNAYGARVVSFLLAATATWVWNRRVTFAARRSGRSVLSEWGHWMGLMTAGALVNYAVYAGLLAGFPWLYRWPAIAVTAGSVVAALVNFSTARGVLFRRSKSSA